MYGTAIFFALIQWGLAAPRPIVSPNIDSVIAGNYIVKFKDDSSITTMDSVLGMLSDEEKPRHIYNEIFRGFSGKLQNSTLYRLQGHPEVGHFSVNRYKTNSTY
jgi:hypothetical protein